MSLPHGKQLRASWFFIEMFLSVTWRVSFANCNSFLDSWGCNKGNFQGLWVIWEKALLRYLLCSSHTAENGSPRWMLIRFLLGVWIYSCPAKKTASPKQCSKMWVCEEMPVPSGNAKTAVPSNHHTKTNNSDNSFSVSDNNLASQMSCLFVILSSLSLASVGANQ